MEVGILAYGGYIPKSRLQREEIFKAHSWFNPGLKGLSRGERSIANWDEDSVTMAVESARDCVSPDARSNISAVYMASTTFPFQDRQNAGIVADALNMKSNIQTLDFTSSMRAGTAALSVALQASKGADGPILLTSAEKRMTKAGSALELTTGDGAATFLIGSGNIVARLLGKHSESVDFVDHFRGEDGHYDYTWEERWVKEEGYLKIVPTAVEGALKQAGITAADISSFNFPVAARNVAATLAKKLGIAEDAVADNLQANCGEAGSAHILIMLAKALQEAEPGDKILIASFGQGCDALIFEATDAIKSVRPSTGIMGSLARGRRDTNYNRFLAF
ncbi:MAG: hydroxymethylglutaryl-CoA synthase family protein, partial [Sneathiella sp.]|nr:hydroxymethylglutaryl-CoA synthase family protein [Sneathiella sp.]